jgi:thioredoxin reductase/NAD-dependent dihydropyrimidine dehydrogenase PreA subunit
VGIVLGLGALAIVVVVALQVFLGRRAAAKEDLAHAQHQKNVERNVQPVSLHPAVDLEACIGSGACVTSCPEKDVLAVVDGKAHLVHPTACIGHGECLRACPVEAIKLVIGTEQRGVDIPLLSTDFATNVPGIYIVGELGGMGLIYNAMTQGLQCMRSILKSPPPRAAGVHQVAIVGAGPAGIAAALAALEAKLDFVIVDQDSVGGTVLHYPRHKIVMTRPVELPLFGKLKVTEVSKEALLETWNQLLSKTGLQVRTGVRVDDVQKGADGTFTLNTSQGPLRAQRIVLAMGRRGSPRKLDVPGEELSKVCYRLLEPEAYANAKCLVVGGGDAAVEAAIALGEVGATVHLAHRGDGFDRIKPKNQERLDASAKAGKVTVLLKAQTKHIRPEAVALEVGGAAQELHNDYVLIFAGGVLPTAFLEKAGVQVKTMRGEAYAPANR